MLKKILSVCMASMLMLAPVAASADQIYSRNYGNWELMAWDGNNRFCALKTYIGDKTLSIRMTSRNGFTVVVYDPDVSLRVGDASVDISFDDEYYGSYTETTYSQWRQQAFIRVGHDPDFLNYVIGANTIHIKSVDVDYNLNLIGTEKLGEILPNCVDTFGF